MLEAQAAMARRQIPVYGVGRFLPTPSSDDSEGTVNLGRGLKDKEEHKVGTGRGES